MSLKYPEKLSDHGKTLKLPTDYVRADLFDRVLDRLKEEAPAAASALMEELVPELRGCRGIRRETPEEEKTNMMKRVELCRAADKALAEEESKQK